MEKAFWEEGFAEKIISDAEYFLREWYDQDDDNSHQKASAFGLALKHLDSLKACTIAIRHCDLSSLTARVLHTRLWTLPGAGRRIRNCWRSGWF